MSMDLEWLRGIANGLCPALPQALFPIPLFGFMMGLVAQILCTLAEVFLSLPDELLAPFFRG